MDFIDEIKAIAVRIPKQIDVIKTEEATKNAFVMPFIGALGYNVFDPTEVVPELIADVGIKKGEKVDYAVLKDGKVIMLFECKWHGADLDKEHASQLHRYFHVTEARIGVLTNGIIYRFFTDLEEPNKMDSKPFLELNMLDIQDPIADEVKRFSKSSFAIDDIISAAQELKYTNEIMRVIREQFNEPSEEFVKFFALKVYHGKVTQKIAQQFADFTKRAFHQFVKDRITEKFKTALSTELHVTPQMLPQPPMPEVELPSPNLNLKEERIITTEEELEAFHIVKSIVREVIEPKRIRLRDTQTYAGILLDDNNRKPICRLFLNGTNKYVLLMGANRDERKIPLATLNDLYALTEDLKSAAISYETAKVSKVAESV